MSTRILLGDCRATLRSLPDNSVHCVVTSPPYFGLRDYGTATWDGGDPLCDHRGDAQQSHSSTLAGNGHGTGKPLSSHLQSMARPFRMTCGKCGANRVDNQIGLEPTPAEFVADMVDVFREVRRVLRKDGTLWLNLGDSYCNDGKWGGRSGGPNARGGLDRERIALVPRHRRARSGLKPKDRLMIPARTAIALQDDGWWLRDEIVWHKPCPMPSSVKDRTTPAHEMLYLLTKRARYHYDHEAIREPAARPEGPGNVKPTRSPPGEREGENANVRGSLHTIGPRETRQKRSVWTVPPSPFKEAHFATFPPALVEPCILAGCPEGGTVLDPFGGAGTTALVANRLRRDAILCELNPEYARIATRRLEADAGLFAQVSAEAA
ncbi:DNA-methyltransferase [Methylobacterium tardum]|uniref:DNA-methyltransferase n=1 Tax=Methylobacterium tardum TaxID=374432 RepID=UPI002020E092|nr:site-specific DNA-methyltransferase [Methylobacterium tardum]URD39575.1 site-specific DNA-methyltransferase [Methylobacterium tardum]